MRELRNRTRGKLNATINAKPVSVYLNHMSSSWESYEAARRLKRERARARAGERGAAPTGDAEVAGVGIISYADRSDLGAPNRPIGSSLV
jgi:hypothetical protein